MFNNVAFSFDNCIYCNSKVVESHSLMFPSMNLPTDTFKRSVSVMYFLLDGLYTGLQWNEGNGQSRRRLGYSAMFLIKNDILQTQQYMYASKCGYAHTFQFAIYNNFISDKSELNS